MMGYVIGRLGWVSLLLGLFASGFLLGGDLSGHVGLETRLFQHDAIAAEQERWDLAASVNLTYYHDWDNRQQRFVFSPFFRYDKVDSERTHFDFAELYYRKTLGDWDVYIGNRKVFWGVIESLHLVDIINQTDLVENLDGEDKLGQPMVSLTWLKDWGTLDFFVMPYFRERTFPGAAGRLRSSLIVDTNQPIYESSDKEHHLDFALRFSQTWGNWDLGLAHFSGTNRDPRLLLGTNHEQGTVLIPHYDQLEQSSVDLQFTGAAWLWKLEAVARDTYDGSSQAGVGGFEYSFVGIFQSPTDLGLVLEYQYDNRDGPTISDNDLVIGTRFTFNDTQDTDLLAIAVFDTQNQSQFFSVEGNRRLGQQWAIDLEARFFNRIDQKDPLLPFENEDYLELRLTRYF